jgi:DNA polymerase III sliding clamp (beta) subunit (PCNA family)
VLGEEKVTMELWDGERPSVLRAAGRDDFLCVLMPMKRPEGESEEAS